MKLNRKYALALAGLLGALLLFVALGCSDKPDNPSNMSKTTIEVGFLKTSLAERVDEVRLTVIFEDEIVYQESTELTNGSFNFGTIEVPVGSVLFNLEAFDIAPDDQAILLYGGSTTKEVVAGGNVEVELELLPVVPMVRLSPYYFETLEGQQITTKIELWNLQAFNNGAFTIDFNPSQLTFDGTQQLNSNWGPLTISAGDVQGQIQLTVNRTGGAENIPAGTVELYGVKFIAQTAGLATLTLGVAELLDNDGTVPELADGLLEIDDQTILITDTGTETGAITGVVTDARTSNPIFGAAVSVVGPASSQTTTNEGGAFALPNLPFGTYQLTVQISGYVTTDRTVNHQAGVTLENVTLSETLQAGQYRVVLTWGDHPRDLDAHMWTTINDSLYEVYYGSEGDSIAPPNMLLDIDQTLGNGPETITIYDLVSDCVFAVKNFTPEDGLITESRALVEVYAADSDEAIAVYQIPTTGTGTWWYVFDLSVQGQLTTRNTISTTPPLPSDDEPLGKKVAVKRE